MPCIIAEELLGERDSERLGLHIANSSDTCDGTERVISESDYGINDYKVFNFNGTPKIIQVDYDRFTNHMHNLYATDWEYINAEIQYPSDSERKISQPGVLDEMLASAEKLSAYRFKNRAEKVCKVV